MTARWHLGPIKGWELLADPRLLARDPRLPLLHDHRPEDDPEEPDGAARVRGRDRAARRRSDRAADRPSSGRRWRCSQRSPSRARCGRSSSWRARGRGSLRPPTLGRAARGAAALAAAGAFVGLVVLAGLPARSSGVASAARVTRRAPRRHRPALAGRRRRSSTARRHCRIAARPGRRPPGRGRRAARRATSSAQPRRGRRPAGRGLGAHRRVPGRRSTCPTTPRAHAADARARRRPVGAASSSLPRGNGRARDVHRLAADGGRAERPGALRPDARAGAPERPLPHRRHARRHRRRLAVPVVAEARHRRRRARRGAARRRRAARGARLPPRAPSASRRLPTRSR